MSHNIKPRESGVSYCTFTSIGASYKCQLNGEYNFMGNDQPNRPVQPNEGEDNGGRETTPTE